MKTIKQLNQIKNYGLILVLFAIANLFPNKVEAQVTISESSQVTDEA